MAAVQTIPSGFTVRPASLDDVATVTAVMAASAHAVLGEDDVSTEEVDSDLRRAGLDLERDTFLVFDAAGGAVAYGESVDEDARAFIDVYLSPTLPDDDYRALGGWLTGACLDRVEQLVRASRRPAVPVSCGCYRDEPRLAQVLREAGLAPVRVFWRMGVHLDDRHLTPPPLPDGVRLRKADVDDPADARLLHALKTDAFREHFGWVEETFEAFWERLRRPPIFDPSLWWVAEVDGQPAGLLVADNRRAEEGCGWVRTLGVVSEHRGRGAAKALLLEAFAEFRRRGLSRARLAVDAENATGATELYESVGMSADVVIDTYSVTLPR